MFAFRSSGKIAYVMQVKKDDIKEKLVAVAHNEFIKHGVKKTSMRVISKASGVALGNIYKYFKNKDELLHTVLTPLLHALDEHMAYNNSNDNLTIGIFSIESLQRELMKRLLKIIKTYRAELRLLFFDTAETSLGGYRKWLIDQQMRRSIEYLELMKEKFPQQKVEFSPFLMRICGAMWVTVLTEIVADDQLTDEEIERFLLEYIKFGAAGWCKVLEIK